MKTIAIANQKGGVGKTNICFNLAGVLSESGRKILIVDMDAQGTMTSIFYGKKRFKPSVSHLLEDDPAFEIGDVLQNTHLENIYLLPSSNHMENLDARLSRYSDARHFLREALEEIRDNYDIILIDCPPSTVIATEMALVAAEGVIAPIQSANEAVMASGKLLEQIEAAKKHNKNMSFLGFVVNLYSSRRSVQQHFCEEIREAQKGKVFETMFKNNAEYEESTVCQTPITMYRPKSSQADLYRQFVKELHLT